MSVQPGKRSADDDSISPAKKSKICESRVNFQYFTPSEASVGIEQYISSVRGFKGVIKQRFSDFVVNEIAPNGKVVRLTSYDLPPSDPVEEQSRKEVDSVLADDQREQLQQLANGERDGVEIDVSSLSKDERAIIHKCIRNDFVGLDSQTKDGSGDVKLITVTKKSLLPGGRKERRYWPPNRGNFTVFHLYKENCDTMDAINQISSIMKIKPSCFSYAGTKDRRAKTCQRVSIYRVQANNLNGLNKRNWNIRVGNLGYEQKQIQLGDLAGNRFDLILREVCGEKEDIDMAMKLLSENGFINYYGLQRFGTTSVATHHIGRAILKEDYEEAVDLILKPRDGGNDNLIACRKQWSETRDAEKCLSLLRFKGSLEGLLLQGIVKNAKGNFCNALFNLPRNTRLLYVHSYQSYIWNKCVSRRIAKYGVRVLEGDLIMPSALLASCDNEEQEETNNGRESRWKKPDVVTDPANASIFDVVMPVPGYSIVYPSNEIAEWYAEVVAEDGLTLECFKARNKSFSMSGCYRHMVCAPQDVQWEHLTYTDPDLALIRTDRDILEDVALPQQPDGEAKQALRVTFSLASSSYATMALREVMRNPVQEELPEVEQETITKVEIETGNGDAQPVVS